MIQAITPYGRSGPSSRVRVFEWFEHTSAAHSIFSYISAANASPRTLGRRPLAVLVAEWGLRDLATRGMDRLLLHREASPLSRGGVERRLLAAGDFTVYDFDDALQWDCGEGPIFRRMAPKAPKAVLAARQADRVIAGNEVLANWASSHSSDVVVIPSCVAPNSYKQKHDYQLADPPRLVWIGSADNESYLATISPALLEINRRTGARLTLISRRHRTLGPLEAIIDRVSWTENTQHRTLCEYDVGIAPLPDEPYTRGKCGYKLLQYGAAGLPVVASPVGVNESILSRFGLPGPTRDDEWIASVVALLELAAEDRERVGRRAREVVELEYSYEAWLPTWEQAVGITSP